jgi:site-specific DNA-adenine methylase
MSDINTILSNMWNDYIQMNPQAQKIVNLLEENGDKVVNDHIALRTFNDPRVSIDVLAAPFVKAGYVESGDYQFVEKKLYAKHYEHSDSNLPKIFISELKLEEFSDNFQSTVKSLIDQVGDRAKNDDFTYSGRPWSLDSATYSKLKEESDYGAWLGAIGYRPNHFTVFINALAKFDEVAQLNTFLKENGIELNSSGGEVKGSKDVFLEQSSTTRR